VRTWSAIPDTEYRVQFKNALRDTSWTDLLPDVTAGGPAASLSVFAVAARACYGIAVTVLHACLADVCGVRRPCSSQDYPLMYPSCTLL